MHFQCHDCYDRKQQALAGVSPNFRVLQLLASSKAAVLHLLLQLPTPQPQPFQASHHHWLPKVIHRVVETQLGMIFSLQLYPSPAAHCNFVSNITKRFLPKTSVVTQAQISNSSTKFLLLEKKPVRSQSPYCDVPTQSAQKFAAKEVSKTDVRLSKSEVAKVLVAPFRPPGPASLLRRLASASSSPSATFLAPCRVSHGAAKVPAGNHVK